MNNSLPITFILMPVAILEGIIMILISIPLLIKAIKPNRFYGFRTRKTLSSPEFWYKANKYAAKELIAAGMVIIMLSIFTMLAFFGVGMFTAIQSVALYIMVSSIPLMFAVVRSMLYLRKL
jgi:uncharacterized membrane protein